MRLRCLPVTVWRWWRPNTKDRLKAAELLGKRHRLFTDKVEVANAVPVIICGSDELE